MTIWQSLISAVKQKSNHAGNWLRNGKPGADPKTRQTERNRLRAYWFGVICGKHGRANLDGMLAETRAERRKLARAYASKTWREMRLKRLAAQAVIA